MINLRKLVQRSLSLEALRNLVPHIEALALSAMNSWGGDGQVINTFKEMKRVGLIFAANIICVCMCIAFILNWLIDTGPMIGWIIILLFIFKHWWVSHFWHLFMYILLYKWDSDSNSATEHHIGHIAEATNRPRRVSKKPTYLLCAKAPSACRIFQSLLQHSTSLFVVIINYTAIWISVSYSSINM